MIGYELAQNGVLIIDHQFKLELHTTLGNHRSHTQKGEISVKFELPLSGAVNRETRNAKTMF